MSGIWPVFAIVFFVWMMTRRSCWPRSDRRIQPDMRDDAIDRLNERVRALEKIITDNDWQLRRDIDGLGR